MDESLWSTDPKLSSPTFEAFKQQAAPALLHHYTTQTGLIGIVSTAELWATKVQCMNDATEFTIALDLASSIAGEKLKGLDPESNEAKKLKRLSDAQIGSVHIFASSFCVEGDLLGQWREYGGETAGYSLGFNAEMLAEISEAAGFKLGPCIYEEEVQKKIVAELIEGCIADPGQDIDEFKVAIAAVGAFFKHPSFSEEREWRVVSKVTFITNENVGFRTGRSHILPFFKIKLMTDDSFLIESVMIGPCPHPKLSNDVVIGLLYRFDRHKAVEDGWIEVTNSAIPYRNW